MLRGAIIISSVVGSMIFLRRRYTLIQWICLITICLGLCLIGINLVKDKDKNLLRGSLWIGLKFSICASCFQAAQFIIEEKLLRKYYLSPFKVIGYEGIFGVALSGTFLLVAQFIP